MNAMNKAERAATIKGSQINHPDGKVEMTPDGRVHMMFARELAHPVARVWQAITDPAETPGWFGELTEFEPRVGGAVCYVGGSKDGSGDHSLVCKGVITRFEAGRVLEFDCSEGVLGFELTPTASGCRLNFWNTLPTGQKRSNSTTAGWHLMLEYLDGALCGCPVDRETETRDRVIEIYFLYRGEKRS